MLLPMRTVFLSMLLLSMANPACAGKGKKGKEPPPPPPDPLLPVSQDEFKAAFEDVELDGEFWVPLAQYERGPKTAFVAVPVERVGDILHTRAAMVVLEDDGRIQEVPFLSTMQIAGLLGGRDYTEYERHEGLDPAAIPDALRQSFEQYANGARAGAVYATTTALQALGRTHKLDWFGQSGEGVKMLERAVQNTFTIETSRDPSEAREHIVLIIDGERVVMLLAEGDRDEWVVDRRE